MIINANLISLIGGRKVNALLTSNIYSFKLGMSNRTRYAEQYNNVEGLARAFLETMN